MCNRSNKGFTLVELMLAMTITAMLLAAVGTAVHGALHSYTQNENLADAMQTTRAVLAQIARDIRTADTYHGEDASHYDVTWNSGTKKLTLIPPDVGINSIEYEFASGELNKRIVTGAGTTTHTLIAASDRVQVTGFTVDTEQDPAESDRTLSVTITLTLQAGGISYPMTTTASPRRNQTY